MIFVGSSRSKSNLCSSFSSTIWKPKFPFGEIAALDRFPQIAAMEVGVFAGDFLRFIPDQRMHALDRFPVKLHEAGFALGVDQPEGVDAKPFHHRQAARKRAIGHHPHQHVHAFGRQRDEIPERIVRRSRLRNLIVRLGLHRVDQVGKLDGILDEEDRDVVADQIPHAFVGVKLDGKSAHVARRIRRPARAGHRGEPHEHRRLLATGPETSPALLISASGS